jgi:hypothetical protein
MGYDYSVSMEGVRAAENQLNQTARKVSRMGTENRPADGTSDRLTLSGDMDIAGAMVEAKQAKILAQANLRVISMQAELEEETLDLFG